MYLEPRFGPAFLGPFAAIALKLLHMYVPPMVRPTKFGHHSPPHRRMQDIDAAPRCSSMVERLKRSKKKSNIYVYAGGGG